MGLDMYLTRKKYVGANYDFNKVTGEIKIYKGGKELPIDLEKVTYINEQVGYWRKANHIHKWFIDNVQKGNDDCKSYYVDISKLEELLEICKKVKKSCKLKEKRIEENGEKYNMKVIENPKIAEELLPCQSGFFFGSTEYNEYYLQNIDETIKILTNIIKQEEEYNKQGIYNEFEYRASW